MISISFIIPCYNYAHYLATAIHSILAVIEPQDELIIIDDGSTDHTADVVRSLQKIHCFHYCHQAHGGLSVARNQGIEQAQKEYIYFLDADDQVLADGFKQLRQAVENQPNQAMILAGHVSRQAGQDKTHWQRAALSDPQRNFVNYALNRKISIVHGAVLIRRLVALRYPYPNHLPLSNDFVVYAWILANESVACISVPSVMILKHQDSLRHQLVHYQEVVEKLPDTVFSPDKLPVTLMGYRHRFYCQRLLSLFRLQYQQGEIAKCRHTYHLAIRCRFLNIVKWSYLRKYLRTWLG